MLGFWRKCRITFRWMRFVIWFVVLAALLSLAWFNLVGLPDFLKTRLVATLHEHGVQLEFTRMRWRLIHGLVAENVRVGGQNNPAQPTLTAGEVELRLDYSALRHGHFQLAGVVVRDGKLTLPVSPTNSLKLLNLRTEVRFLPGNTWSLDEFRADFAGTKILLAGQVAHALQVTNWTTFAGRKTGGRGALARPLQDFANTLAKIQFSQRPQFNVRLDGDARDIHSFIMRLNFNAPGVATPWFSASGLQLAANVTAPADIPTNFDSTLGFWTNARPFRLAWIARAAELHLRGVNAVHAECNGVWRAPKLALTKLSAQLAGGELAVTAGLDVATRQLAFTNDSAFDPHVLQTWLPEPARRELAAVSWEEPPVLHTTGALKLPSWTNNATAWRRDINPTAARLNGEIAFTNAFTHGLKLDWARTHFALDNFIWKVPNLELAQGRSRLKLSGEFSMATENFRCRLSGAADPESARPLLPPGPAKHELDDFQFSRPLTLDVTAAGNLRNLNTLSAAGHLALTNFSVREQSIDSVASDFNYTNRVLDFLHPVLFRQGGTQTMTANAIALDFNSRLILFTNGFSTVGPQPVCTAIGPKTEEIVAPYDQFLSPPTTLVHGQLPLREIKKPSDLKDTDMTFKVIRGAPYRVGRFSTTNLAGTLHWRGPWLFLTNVQAALYGGHGHGHVTFDFRPVGYGCDFHFGIAVTNVDVRLLAEDLAPDSTNKLEGILSGRAEVTTANSKTWRSWNGYGAAQLHNGLLWNIPIFGLASPLLNAVVPGLGNSRATDASARFVMTNGVIHSDSLEIHTATMRLEYTGTVDLEQNVNALVTAQLMRNVPLIGSLVSLALSPVSKVFECQVTGQLNDPKVTPIYVPFSKYLLNPVHSLEQMIPSGEKPKDNE